MICLKLVRVRFVLYEYQHEERRGMMPGGSRTSYCVEFWPIAPSPSSLGSLPKLFKTITSRLIPWTAQSFASSFEPRIDCDDTHGGNPEYWYRGRRNT